MLIIKESNSNAVDLACDFLRRGKIISFGSDTVYGIAVDALNSQAVENLYHLKNRDEKKPVAIFVKDLAAAKKIFMFDELSEKIATKFFPGSLTMVLKIKPESAELFPSCLNKKADGFLGFRIIDCEFVKNLLEKFGGILAVSSANPANQTAATNGEEVEKYFTKSNLDLLIDGGESKQKQASTVVKISNGNLEILRLGAISKSNFLNL